MYIYFLHNELIAQRHRSGGFLQVEVPVLPQVLVLDCCHRGHRHGQLLCFRLPDLRAIRLGNPPRPPHAPIPADRFHHHGQENPELQSSHSGNVPYHPFDPVVHHLGGLLFARQDPL